MFKRVAHFTSLLLYFLNPNGQKRSIFILLDRKFVKNRARRSLFECDWTKSEHRNSLFLCGKLNITLS